MSTFLQFVGAWVIFSVFGVLALLSIAPAWHDARDRWRTMRADRSAARHQRRAGRAKARAR